MIPPASAAEYSHGQTEYSIIGNQGWPLSRIEPFGRPTVTLGLSITPGVVTSSVATSRQPSSETARTQTRYVVEASRPISVAVGVPPPVTPTGAHAVGTPKSETP